jgi:hypothetical protein
MSQAAQSVEWVFCNECLRKTRHDTIALVSQDEQIDLDNGWTIDWHHIYRTLQCRGCENVTYHTRRWSSEDIDEDGISYHDTYYPPISTTVVDVVLYASVMVLCTRGSRCDERQSHPATA